MSDKSQKSIGQAIDEIVNALQSVDPKSRPTAIKAACEVLEIDLTLSTIPAAKAEQPLGSSTGSSSLHPTTDIRSLKERKQPSNSQEMACLVAYYLQELAPAEDRKNEIGTEDLDKYFRQAEYPLPKSIAQVLVDAKASGYFDRPKQGVYKLNPVGYNLAVHGLPRKSVSK